MKHIKLKSYAKINLSLKINNKCNNGYHNISSVMQTISLHDTVKLKKNKKIICKVNVKSIPVDENNLAVKAAKKFFEYLNLNYGVKIIIKKKIPIESGLAGGSSNAATVLLGLNKLYKTNLNRTTLLKIASQIGSDVPFLISGGTALVEGTGDKIYNIKSIQKCFILVVKPKLNISTKEAYLKYDSLKIVQNKSNNSLISAINQEEEIDNVAKFFFNDFEVILNEDFVRKIKKAMLKHAVSCNLTGSGSAFFGMFLKKSKAKIIKKIFKNQRLLSFICTPTEKYF